MADSIKPSKTNSQQKGFLVKQDSPTPTLPVDLSRRSQVDRYLSTLFAQGDATPIAGALVPWFCDALPSPQSRRDYMKVIRHFVGSMREMGVQPLAVNGKHVKMYKAARLESGDRPATVAQALTVIRGMYEQFGQDHLVPWNVVQDIQAIKSPKVEKNTTPAISNQQASKLLHAPDLDTLVGLRDHAMLFTVFYTAIRVTAMATAKVGGLEQIDGEWYVNVTEKRKKERRLLLLEATPAVVRWIEAAGLADQPEWPLFPAFDRDRKTLLQRHLSRDTIRKMVKRYGRKVGIHVDGVVQADGKRRRGVGFHSLRKTALNDALANGAELRDAQEWFGHASITTTQLYTMNTGEEAKRAARHVQIR